MPEQLPENNNSLMSLLCDQFINSAFLVECMVVLWSVCTALTAVSCRDYYKANYNSLLSTSASLALLLPRIEGGCSTCAC